MKDIVNEIRLKIEEIKTLTRDLNPVYGIGNAYNIALIAINTAYVIVLIDKLTEDLQKFVECFFPIRKETKLLPLGRG